MNNQPSLDNWEEEFFRVFVKEYKLFSGIGKHDWTDVSRFISNLISQAKAQGALEERERIRKCVENRGVVFQPVGGLSNMQYLIKSDILQLLTPQKEEKV